MKATRGNVMLKLIELSPVSELGMRGDLSYHAGTVVDVGDVKSSDVHVGDTVVFQLPEFMLASISAQVDNQTVHIVKFNDILGKIDKPSMSFKHFHPSGHWVMVRAEHDNTMTGNFYIPEKFLKISSFTLVESGGLAETPATASSTVFFDLKRATKIGFDDSRDYYFVLDSNILAFVS